MSFLTQKQEAMDIASRNGYFIPQVRFEYLLKVAQRISSTLVNSGLAYTEMLIVIKFVVSNINITTNVKQDEVLEKIEDFFKENEEEIQ